MPQHLCLDHPLWMQHALKINLLDLDALILWSECFGRLIGSLIVNMLLQIMIILILVPVCNLQ